MPFEDGVFPSRSFNPVHPDELRKCQREACHFQDVRTFVSIMNRRGNAMLLSYVIVSWLNESRNAT